MKVFSQNTMFTNESSSAIRYYINNLYIYTIIILKYDCISVAVHKLQVAILVRSSREMSLTVINYACEISNNSLSVLPNNHMQGYNKRSVCAVEH